MYDDEEEYSFKVVCIDAAAAAAAWDIPSISKFEHRLPKINERKITITNVRPKIIEKYARITLYHVLENTNHLHYVDENDKGNSRQQNSLLQRRL